MKKINQLNLSELALRASTALEEIAKHSHANNLMNKSSLNDYLKLSQYLKKRANELGSNK